MGQVKSMILKDKNSFYYFWLLTLSLHLHLSGSHRRVDLRPSCRLVLPVVAQS